MNALEVHGLHMVRGPFRLEDVDLVLPTGLVMGFVGPNGAGKTTTIKALLGMLRPDSGTVELLDERAVLVPQVMERVGVVLDQSFLSPDWRVSNVGRRLSRFYTRWDEAAFQNRLGQFEVPTSGRISTLSRGQSVKLSLAVALAHHPELLVLDEPSSGLDPVSRAELLDVIRAFMIDESHSVLFSTHITSDLDDLADLLVVLEHGRVAWSGPMTELQEQFAVVRGQGALAGAAEAAIMGLRREGERFDGLIRVSDSALFGPSSELDFATTDDVIVRFARQSKSTKESSL